MESILATNSSAAAQLRSLAKILSSAVTAAVDDFMYIVLEGDDHVASDLEAHIAKQGGEDFFVALNELRPTWMKEVFLTGSGLPGEADPYSNDVLDALFTFPTFRQQLLAFLDDRDRILAFFAGNLWDDSDTPFGRAYRCLLGSGEHVLPLRKLLVKHLPMEEPIMRAALEDAMKEQSHDIPGELDQVWLLGGLPEVLAAMESEEVKEKLMAKYERKWEDEDDGEDEEEEEDDDEDEDEDEDEDPQEMHHFGKRPRTSDAAGVAKAARR